jgi:hypothetical protein
MFFNRRKKFNGQVSSLLPGVGVDINDAGTFKVLEILDVEWQQGHNEYEATLVVAYLYVSGLYGNGRAKEASNVIDKINFVENDWLKKGIVTQQFISTFRSNAEKLWTTKLNK